MENNEVKLRAVETITGKKVKITVDHVHGLSLSFIDRLLIRLKLKKAPPEQREFEIGPIYLGNMERIGARSLNIPDDVLKQSLSSLVVAGSEKYIKDFIYIVAVGIQNNRDEPSQELQDFIRWNFTMEDIFRVCDIVLSKSDYQSFINTTVLIKGADALHATETDATNVTAPDKEKSGQLAGEIIAPGPL